MPKQSEKLADNKMLALTIKQFCQRVGISRSSVYLYAKKGQIRLTRICGRTVICASEIDRLLNGTAA